MMSNNPPDRQNEPPLNLEAASAEELGRGFVISPEKLDADNSVSAPPPCRRCDSAHRELLRQPFALMR